MDQPLTPPDCNLGDFPFMPLDVRRLLTSETWITGTADEKCAAMTLWLESWHQVPAASIPNNDKMLAHLSGAGGKWSKVKAHVLRGWKDGGDGRLYHPVVAEKALEAWIEKLSAAISGNVGNAKRWGIEIDNNPLQESLCHAVDQLKKIAPRSKALSKKTAKIVESRSLASNKKSSPADRPPIAPRSQPESHLDRGPIAIDRDRDRDIDIYTPLPPQGESVGGGAKPEPGTEPGYPDFQPKGDPRLVTFATLGHKSPPADWTSKARERYPELNAKGISDLWNGFESHYKAQPGMVFTSAQWSAKWDNWVVNNHRTAIRNQAKTDQYGRPPEPERQTETPPPQEHIKTAFAGLELSLFKRAKAMQPDLTQDFVRGLSEQQGRDVVEILQELITSTGEAAT